MKKFLPFLIAQFLLQLSHAQNEFNANVQLNNGGSLIFQEPSGGNYMSFQAGSMSSNVTYTLPTGDAAGVLGSNGSGMLSWLATSSISPFTQASGNVYLNNNSWMLGIGTSTPAAVLNVSACTSNPLLQLDIPTLSCGSTARPDYFVANTDIQVFDEATTVRTDFIIKGSGAVGIGNAAPSSQLDIKSVGTFSSVFHINDATYGDLLNVAKQGYVGIGQVNSGTAMVEISDINSLGVPQLQVDDGSNIFFMVRTNEAGVGIDPGNLSLNSTLALYGNGSTTLDLYEPTYTSASNAQIRMIGDGSVRHIITDSGAAGAMIIHPGNAGGAANRLRVQGDLAATGSAYIGSNEIVNGNLAVNGTMQFNGPVVIGSVSSPNPQSYSPTPGYMLYVQYGVLTEQVKVAMHTTGDWSDFVFDKDYKLPTLGELDEYIKNNHHLPEVPSAEEVVCEGLDVGKMDAKLLQKIEELTLYVLELKRENEKQGEEIRSLLK